MLFEKSVDFIFKLASKRIDSKIKVSGLKQEDIYSDTTQISRIINNKRDKNKNRYLITDTVLEHGLLEKLDFKNKSEILWGTHEEIKLYINDLFYLLFDEVTNNEKKYSIDKKLLLCDHIPYAQCLGFNEIIIYNNQNTPKIEHIPVSKVYHLNEESLPIELSRFEREAIDYLYQKCNSIFLNDFISFTKEITTFKQIDKHIEEKLIFKRFIPMLKKFYPNKDSLGLRTRNIIKTDFLKLTRIYHSRDINKIAHQVKLVKEDLKYIIELEKLQN